MLLRTSSFLSGPRQVTLERSSRFAWCNFSCRSTHRRRRDVSTTRPVIGYATLPGLKTREESQEFSKNRWKLRSEADNNDKHASHRSGKRPDNWTGSRCDQPWLPCQCNAVIVGKSVELCEATMIPRPGSSGSLAQSTSVRRRNFEVQP